MPDDGLVIENASKHFASFIALQSVHLCIERGQFVLLAGANGAGKSTLLRLMAGISSPSSGRVLIDGKDPQRDAAARSAIGFLSHHTLLYDDLSAEENLVFFARIYALESPRQRVDDALEKVGLSAHRHRRLRTFSRGMRQRLALSASNATQPGHSALRRTFYGPAPTRPRGAEWSTARPQTGRPYLCHGHAQPRRRCRPGGPTRRFAQRVSLPRSGMGGIRSRSCHNLRTFLGRSPLSFWRRTMAILHKDLTAEWRTKERLSPMGFFSLLVLLVFNFSFELGGAALHEIGPGVLWSAFVFACLLGLNRSFADERENHSLDALLMAPGDRGAIYLGKMIANLVFLLAVELICLPFFALFFNLSPGFFLLPLLGVLVFGSACLSAAGTLFAALRAPCARANYCCRCSCYP